jgi:Holliday junction resolvasome RuvABC endonuclease subunit
MSTPALFNTEVPAAPAAAGPRPLRVLTLDLSITATGVCLPDGATYTITTNAKDGDRRLQHIVDNIGIALGESSDTRDGVDLVAIEGPVVRSSAAVIIGMVHGAVRLRLLDFNTPYVLITPATLKAYATGKGNADKTAMAIAALKRAGREFADDNQCDAWWLRAAALDWYGQPEFELPKAQRDRLAKITWPNLAAVTP